ncbi:MAG: c-type cytochrome domain-containing protein, partial [Rubripirellula sp.]
MKSHCADCHGKTKPEATLCFDGLPTDFAVGNSVNSSLVETWQRIHEQITLGAMPPEGSSQLSVMEVDYVTEW